jgi:hypothetical protein
VIEINETQPTEASLTIVLRGPGIEVFKEMISRLYYREALDGEIFDLVDSLAKELS